MLEAAGRIFARSGYGSASMEQIAEAVGVSKPMLYSYFGSKEGLFLACVDGAAESIRREVRAAVVDSPTPELRLWRGLVAVFGFVEENRESWSILYPYGPTSAGPFAEGAGRARDAMAELLVELFADTAIGAGVDPEVAPETEPLAHALVGATIALASWWRQRPDESRELQAMRLMNFAWMGLGDLIEGRMWIPPPEA